MRRITAFDLAARYVGTRELPGGLDNPHILAWLMDAGVADPRQAGLLYHDEVPWCGAFVAHPVRLAGLELPKIPARARSWLTVGEPIAIERAEAAWDVVVLQRGDGAQPGPDVLAAPGHVGFFFDLETSRGLVHLLGGNQGGDQVSIAGFPVHRVLGVQRLFSEVEL